LDDFHGVKDGAKMVKLCSKSQGQDGVMGWRCHDDASRRPRASLLLLLLQ
jgi:hypothetical protein